MNASLFFSLANRVERCLIGLADMASSISPQMCAKLVDKGVPADRVVEIRNWADGKLTAIDTADSPYRHEWGG
jgi:colanic acid biosynthesis glycosyl transferase WcaI